MKLHIIAVQGMWAYRERVEVDLTGLPLVVAVGDNGTGKSALAVHAVLAGLYGKLPTRTVEESISHGLPRGEVTVTFTVGAGHYRVRRVFSRTGTGSAFLHVLDDQAQWKAVTEKGVREVTAKVTDLLGMPYEPAVMTWVAQQGEYGKFASALPAERFRLLSGVYGLDTYAPLYKAALERQRTQKEHLAILDGRVVELSDGLIVEDEQVKTGLAALSDADLLAQPAAARQAVDDTAAALATHHAQSPAAAAERADAAYSAVRDAREVTLRHSEALLASATAARDASANRYERALTQAQTQFDAHAARLTQQAAAEQLALTREMEDGQEQVNTLLGIQATLPDLDAAHESAATDLSALIDTIADLTAAQRAAEQDTRDALTDAAGHDSAIADAEQALTDLHDAGACITCGQHLPTTVLDAVRAQFTQARDEHTPARADAHARAVQARERADAHTQALSVHELTRTQLTARAEMLRSAAFNAHRVVLDIAAAQARVEAAGTRHAQVLHTAEQEIARLRAELEDTCRIATETRVAEVVAADADIATATAQIATSTAPSTQEETLRAQANEAREAAAATGDETERLRELTAARTDASAQAAAFEAEAGRRAEVARRIAEQGERLRTAQRTAADAKKALGTTQQLVEAYSPQGIPSMILESVIDELSQVVNARLTELSSGELLVRIQTTRETATGSQEPRVTVYVDTSTGTRSYEALSGGQRFRVDLAIRMGLAVVVAAGTGTPIETFVLDEGWGTLDENGIRSTLRVLHQVSEQMHVLTVSHIASVRDAFPARIEVTGAQGVSHAEVSAA